MLKFKDLQIGDVFYFPHDSVITFTKNPQTGGSCPCSRSNATNNINGVKTFVKDTDVVIKVEND